jgi:hypothetical protein
MTGKNFIKKYWSRKKGRSKKEEREDEIRMNSIVFATAFRMALGHRE